MPECNLCGAAGPELLYRVGAWPISRCRACGLVYVDAVPGAEELSAYYAADYYGGRADAYSDYERDREILEANFRRQLTDIEKLHPPGRLLDVGCALGFFLKAAADRGWNVTGVDISEYGTGYAREKLGLDARTGSLLDADLPAGGFDVVTMWDTIEHLVDPRSYVRRAAQLLRPGGSLYLTTGNVDSLYARVAGRRWRLVAPPGHLYYFSPRTAGRMVTEAGLGVRRVSSEGKYASVGAVAHALRLAGLLPAGLKRSQVYFDLGDVFRLHAGKPPG